MKRRNLLALGGGAAAGVVFTPVPWKLMDDSSIWSQNWSWIARPLRGELKTKRTACTLCPRGCPAEVRCVGEQPIAIAPVEGHPLCAAALGMHQLAYHPARLRTALKREGAALRPVRVADAVAAVAGRSPAMIFDQQPGRTASLLFRRFAALAPGAVYAVAPPVQRGTLSALERASGAGLLEFDYAKAGLVLSFGAPVLEDAGAGVPAERVVQIEARHSVSAALASEWIPVRPGGEAALALALAAALRGEEPGEVAGVPRERFSALVKRVKAAGAAIALGPADPVAGAMTRDEQDAFAALNAELRAPVIEWAAVPTGEFGELAAVTQLDAVPAGSIGALVLDDAQSGDALPWAALRRTLRKDAVVVRVSAFADALGGHADFLVPAPAPLEAAGDFAGPGVYGVAAAVLPRPEGAMSGAEFVGAVAAAMKLELPSFEDALKMRAAAVFAARRGDVEAKDADEFRTKLAEGALWRDGSGKAGTAHGPATVAKGADAPAGEGIPLVLHGERGASGVTTPPPLLSKVYQEADVRGETAATLHPETAKALQVEGARQVRVTTASGSVVLPLRISAATMPGIAEVAVRPRAAQFNTDAKLGPAGVLEIAGGRVPRAKVTRA